MKKQFLRVKQIADQTFLRAEKTDVLTEDLLTAEKRVDAIKLSCQSAQKKIISCQIDFGSEVSIEKRLKKIPQVVLGSSLLENGGSFSKSSILGETLRECGNVQTKLGAELLQHYTEVEKLVLKPVATVLENEIHGINKLRKQLGKLVLDMDSARTRLLGAERQQQQQATGSAGGMAKAEVLKEELDEAQQRVDQCRDTLAAEMFSLLSKEPQLAQLFLDFQQLQASYHRSALAALEMSLPLLQNLIGDFPQKPVFGCALEEHLRVSNREVAIVIEMCISFLMEYGISEEGLLRITGSASKVKKLKSAFDAGVELDMSEYVRDPHAVSGAFKSYLRELPEPLLTFSAYDEWISAAKTGDFDTRLQALWQVLQKLPEANYKNLRYVINFLSKLQVNVDVNKMSSGNIAIVMAPNIIWSPNEDLSSLGMNMSTTSLHTLIVDTMISYSDWFFPENESLNCQKVPETQSNLNDSRKNIENEAEVNGNNLQVANSTCPPSPRSPHKKPAPPPPPAQKTDTTPVKDILDLPPAVSVDSLTANEVTPQNTTDQKCFRSFCDAEGVTFRSSNKPAIPDKPNSYSTGSLDRRSYRQSMPSRPVSRGSGSSKASDIMSRSTHLERPSVPPPDRPSKTLSSDSLCRSDSGRSSKPPTLVESDPESPSSCDTIKSSKPGDAAKSISDAPQEAENPCETISDCVEKLPKITKPPRNIASVSKATESIVEASSKSQSQDDSTVEELQGSSSRPETSKVVSPTGITHSQSSSKVNRFDFLVTQKEERPPERPPRGEIPRADVEASAQERPRPPRPQPPVPAKPKMPPISPIENTNL